MAMIPWWIHYPNVNNEIINLDWILQVSNENTDKIENFIGINTIKYADPILWDITSQYEANTIVVDPQTGDAYISTKAVPYGVALSNEGYWTRIYNYASELHVLREQIAADEQLSTTASAPRSVDDLVFLNGLLHRVTTSMIAGDSYVENSNCVKTTINAELQRLHTSISAEAQARADADTAEAQARADADTALGQRIDDEALARANADTALGQRIDDEVQARTDADTALRNLLESSLNTSDRKILFIGDSIMYGTNPDVTSGRIKAFAEYFCDEAGLTVGTNAFIESEPSAGFLAVGQKGNTFQDLLENFSDLDKTEITNIIVVGGLNDAGYTGLTEDMLHNAIKSFVTYAKTNYPNAYVMIGSIACSPSTGYSPYDKLNIVNRCYAMSDYGVNCKPLKYCKSAIHNTDYFASDKIHLNQYGQKSLGKFLISNHYSNFSNAVLTFNSSLFSSTNARIQMLIEDDHVQLKFIEGTLNMTGASINCNNSNEYLLGNISGSLLFGSQYTDAVNFDLFETEAIISDGTNYHHVTAKIYFRNEQVYAKFLAVVNNNFLTINATMLTLLGSQFNFTLAIN